jgi:hypothetical protein
LAAYQCAAEQAMGAAWPAPDAEPRTSETGRDRMACWWEANGERVIELVPFYVGD